MSKINDDFPGAAHLIAAGLGTTAKIDAATDQELLAVEGIGYATLEKIREARRTPEVIEEVPPEVVAEIEQAMAAIVTFQCSNPICGHEIAASPCPYCGR